MKVAVLCTTIGIGSAVITIYQSIIIRELNTEQLFFPPSRCVQQG